MTGANPVADPVASIIIPTLNEENAISETISRIPNPLRGCCQILVIDGLSTDATIDEAKRVGADVLLVDQPGKGFAQRDLLGSDALDVGPAIEEFPQRGG